MGNACLYERLNGVDMHSMVAQWYDLLLQDEHCKGNFLARVTDPEKCQCNLTTFLVKATGGPDHYQGRDIQKMHAEFKITKKMFDNLWKHLETSLVDHGAPRECINELKQLVYSLESNTVNSR